MGQEAPRDLFDPGQHARSAVTGAHQRPHPLDLLTRGACASAATPEHDVELVRGNPGHGPHGGGNPPRDPGERARRGLVTRWEAARGHPRRGRPVPDRVPDRQGPLRARASDLDEQPSGLAPGRSDRLLRASPRQRRARRGQHRGHGWREARPVQGISHAQGPALVTGRKADLVFRKPYRWHTAGPPCADACRARTG